MAFTPSLDSCTKQLMLRRVGGGYIFVHNYLMEHFAYVYSETQTPPAPSDATGLPDAMHSDNIDVPITNRD